MSSRALFFTLLMLLLVPPARSVAFDWGDFTARSDRGDDSFLVSALEEGDFETRLAICESIGSRSEPDAQAILSWILAGYSKGKVHQAELLLRVALVSLFERPSDGPARAARITANAGVLSEIAQAIGTLTDPQLRGTIVRLLPLLDKNVGLKALMETGTGIVQTLKQTGGRLSPQETSLALDYLQGVKAMGTADFFDPCLEMARLSRDKSLVTAARGAASAVSSAPESPRQGVRP
jgi:hypothetical protein